MYTRVDQASANEACNRTRTPLHTSKTDVLKKACLVWLKRLQGVRQIAHLKQQRFLSFTLYKTQRSYEKIMCIYLLFHWFSGDNYIYISFTQRTADFDRLKKRNMNDGTIVFLKSLLVTLTWNILLLVSFWHKIISCFKLKSLVFFSTLTII